MYCRHYHRAARQTSQIAEQRAAAERLTNPRVPSAKPSGHKDRYKIRLRSAGYRLVYEVRESERIVVVVAVGKRERNAVYKAAVKR